MVADGTDRLAQIRTWVARTVGTSAAADDFDLNELSEDELFKFSFDLDGIADASEALANRLARLASQPATADELESQLVEIELDVEEAAKHWASIAAVLRAKDMWMDE